jgi:hypothetical protein
MSSSNSPPPLSPPPPHRRRTLVVVVRRAGLAAATTAAARATTTAATAVVTAAAAHAAAARVEHLHFVGDDFRGVAVLALLVLPLARAQRAFDVDLRALLQVLAGDFTETPEHGHVVPLGAFLVLARLLVFPALAGRHADVRDRHAGRHGAGFRVCAQISDQDDFVDSPRHGRVPFIERNLCGAGLYGQRRLSNRLDSNAFAKIWLIKSSPLSNETCGNSATRVVFRTPTGTPNDGRIGSQ